MSVAGALELRPLRGLPIVQPGDDLAALALEAVRRSEVTLADGDVLAVASKVVSRAEGRFVELAAVRPSPRAVEVAARTGKDPRLCELVLSESVAVSRAAPGVLVVRHRLGFVCANAGIDASNASPGHVLLLPVDPDASAERLRQALSAASGARVAVVITDSHGRPFRLGSVGVAIGASGLPPLADLRGQPDLGGRPLEITMTALADQVAAAADLVAGQAAEGRALVLVRGLAFAPSRAGAAALCRPVAEDLYA